MTTEELFPRDFVWGTATAAYQIEGAATADGRGPSIWDTFCHTPGRVRNGDTGDVACRHYERYEEDLDLLAGLGATAYRFSVSWPRVLPEGRGRVNQAGLDFYRRLVDGALARGIAPFVTLYHWDLPQVLEDQGGWRNRACAEWFADFVDVMGDALGDRVSNWITLNEPIAASFHGYGGHGNAAPGLGLGGPAVAAAHHLLLGHARAVEALRARAVVGQIGTTLNFGPVSPATDDPADVAAAHRLDLLQTRWFADAVLTGSYPADLVDYFGAITDFSFVRPGDLAAIAAPLDFLGVNYYKSWVARATSPEPPERRPASDVGAIQTVPPGREVTGFGWGICPDGMRDLLLTLRDRYDRLPPMYVTENGCAYPDQIGPDGRVDDPDRIRFIHAYLRAAAEAVAKGVDLRGWFVWSLMDNFEWAEGYSQRFGLIHVDYPTGTRTPKSSYWWYRDLIAAHRG